MFENVCPNTVIPTSVCLTIYSGGPLNFMGTPLDQIARRGWTVHKCANQDIYSGPGRASTPSHGRQHGWCKDCGSSLSLMVE